MSGELPSWTEIAERCERTLWKATVLTVLSLGMVAFAIYVMHTACS